MEYIEGYASEKIIEQAKKKERPIPIPIICRIIADAAQGLGFIHNLTDENGVCLELVHRDISPQNLLISKTGTLKIIDFGIVKARQKTSRTRTGVIVGKLQYMSPEQLSSEDLDHRSDIYSLGLVLYELITLRPRFRGNSLLEIFYEAFNEPPPIITDLRLDCPPEVVHCVQKALAQNKEERYAHAYELEDDLERYIHASGMPITQRTIANYIEDLFVGNDKAREETTRIHASAMLSEYRTTNDFGQSIDDDTIHAMDIDELAPDMAKLEDLGELDYATDGVDGTIVIPWPNSSSGTATRTDTISPISHQMPNYDSNLSDLPMGQDYDDHTLSGHHLHSQYNSTNDSTHKPIDRRHTLGEHTQPRALMHPESFHSHSSNQHQQNTPNTESLNREETAHGSWNNMNAAKRWVTELPENNRSHSSATIAHQVNYYPPHTTELNYSDPSVIYNDEDLPPQQETVVFSTSNFNPPNIQTDKQPPISGRISLPQVNLPEPPPRQRVQTPSPPLPAAITRAPNQKEHQAKYHPPNSRTNTPPQNPHIRTTDAVINLKPTEAMNSLPSEAMIHPKPPKISAPNKPNSNSLWIGLSLGLLAFILGIMLVYLFMN
jgi:serine/threonine protein kinase